MNLGKLREMVKDREAWRATVHGLVKSWAQLSEVMRNASLDESQAGIKIGRRNINNLRHGDDTTLTAESEED